MLSSRLSCNSYSLFTLPLLSKQTRHGRNIISFYFFLFISGSTKCYCVSHVRIDAGNSSCLVLQLQSVVYLEQRLSKRMKLDDQWVLTVMKSPTGEKCHQYSSVVTAIIPYLCTIKLQYTLLWDYWECVRPAWLPVLTWVLSSFPLGTPSKICSLLGPRRIQQTKDNKE